MKKLRRRPGQGDDVVWEDRGFVASLLFSESSNFGWHPLCNSASARNQIEEALNALYDKQIRLIAQYAEACAILKSDREGLDNSFNHLGVAPPVPVTKEEIESMLPYTDAVEPRWQEILKPHVVADALKLHGLKKSDTDRDRGPAAPVKPKSADMTITTRQGAASLASEGDHSATVHERGKDKDKSGGNASQHSKKVLNKLKGKNPREDGEDDGTYNRRINQLADEQRA